MVHFICPLYRVEKKWLKVDTVFVDSLYSMIRVTLMDGSLQEVRRNEALGLVPVEGLLRHPLLVSAAIFCYQGKILPVLGPLPEKIQNSGPCESRPWLMIFADHAQVVRGLPQFNDDIRPKKAAPTLVSPKTPKKVEISDDEEEARLLQEMEDLLKSA